MRVSCSSHDIATRSREADGSLPPSNAQAFLDSPGTAKTISEYRRGETIFTRGDACQDVLYIQTGGVTAVGAVEKRSRSRGGDARLGRLFRRRVSGGSAIPDERRDGHHAKRDRAGRETPDGSPAAHPSRMSDRFIAHMLSRKTQIEEDLFDQLFNSNEKRLAGTLLRLARYDIRGARPARCRRPLSMRSPRWRARPRRS